VLEANRERTDSLLADDDLTLDVGGWASPWERADWVIDLMPYSTRGLYGSSDPALERFSAETWVERDICDRGPWPFEDNQFDFAVCSHTLEDVRDPVFVCAELNRVARAGYIEVPSRLQEQSWAVWGDPLVGWSHHRWLVEVDGDRIEFVSKPHVIHANPSFYFPAGVAATLSAEEQVEYLFWDGGFEYGERFFPDAAGLDAYLEAPVARHREALLARVPRPGLRSRLRARLARFR